MQNIGLRARVWIAVACGGLILSPPSARGAPEFDSTSSEGETCDTAVTVRSNYVNLRVFPSDNIDQTEISIAVNPKDEEEILIGVNATNMDIPEGAQGFYNTQDGGFVWSGSDTLPYSRPDGWDPAVEFHSDDTAYFCFLARDSLFLSTSTNSGQSWTSFPVMVEDASTSPDKPHLAVDVLSASHRGNIYVAWRQDGEKYKEIAFSRSTDGGQTFLQTPLVISEPDPPLGSRYRTGVNLAVAPNGAVYAAWFRKGSGVNPSIWFNRSTDGGATFDREWAREICEINSGNFYNPPGWPDKSNLDINSFPVIAVDSSDTSGWGHIYVVWCELDSTDTETDIFMTHSGDGGATWDSVKTRVNDDSLGNGKDQWFPWACVDPGGGLNVVFYDCRNDPDNYMTDVYLARMADPDSDSTFENIRVSDVSFAPCPLPGTDYMGDYIGIDASTDYIYPAWCDNRYRPTGWTRGVYQMMLGVVPIEAEVSGTLSDSATTWSWTKVMTGDVIVDTNKSLTINPWTKVVAKSFTDEEAGGADTSLVELIVYGDLVFEEGAGLQSLFADVDSVGAWYGIRVMPGGSVDWGDGCRILNAVNGVTICESASTDTVRGVCVLNPENAGFYCLSDDVVFVSDTVKDIVDGYGFYLSECDPAIESCVIENCEYGIYAFTSSASIRDCKVEADTGVCGIYAYDPEVLGEDTLEVVGDSILGYYTTSLLCATDEAHCRIDSCIFVGETDADSSQFGIKAYDDAWVYMRRSKIHGYWYIGFYSDESAADLGVASGGVDGDNFIDTAVACPWCLPNVQKSVKHIGSSTLKAENSYWGASSPDSLWFSGNVDYRPWKSSNPLSKIAITYADAMASVPISYSLRQNYPNPFNPSTTVEFSLATPQRVKINVYNILGQLVITLTDQQYAAGHHRVSWDGENSRGERMASGVYFYRLESEGFVQTKKMVVLK